MLDPLHCGRLVLLGAVRLWPTRLLVSVYWKQTLTYTLCRLLGCGGAITGEPAVTSATVQWPLAEVKVAQRRLDTAPVKRQEVPFWREMF